MLSFFIFFYFLLPWVHMIFSFFFSVICGYYMSMPGNFVQSEQSSSDERSEFFESWYPFISIPYYFCRAMQNYVLSKCFFCKKNAFMWSVVYFFFNKYFYMLLVVCMSFQFNINKELFLHLVIARYICIFFLVVVGASFLSAVMILPLKNFSCIHKLMAKEVEDDMESLVQFLECRAYDNFKYTTLFLVFGWTFLMYGLVKINTIYSWGFMCGVVVLYFAVYVDTQEPTKQMVNLKMTKASIQATAESVEQDKKLRALISFERLVLIYGFKDFLMEVWLLILIIL